ncbi:PLAC8-domain-containing protein [Penicillium samsonianum]|uniref:PLAC8-domain-containing protein n=1 Tax=Penicillium samsonianum TaxID=1882272 RepID=UPI002546E2BE|nr:PLAC8-domain-containing protein [Penicillium samsonianum]KAJ6131899.1 PLAC8-domain-containing protein [Penicillium samsonianum]
MADPMLKVYRAWPSQPPTYHQANAGSSDIAQGREWNYSLFGCCSPGTLCLTSCCLPCLTYGKTQTRLRDPELRSFSYVNGSCAIWSVLSIGAVQWIMQTITRGEMREQYGIEGSCCGDCCVSTFCGCCALIQEEKEAELRSRPELAGYQKPPGMDMP